MENKRCFICKYLNPYSGPVEEHGHLYNHAGQSFKIDLCWPHSVQLFKLGQFKFFSPYINLITSKYGDLKDEQILVNTGILERHKLERDIAA